MSDRNKYAPFRGLIAKRMKELEIRTVEEFGERFGISRGTIYTLYSGRISVHGTPVRPSVETLLALSKALQAPFYWLMYLLGPEALGQENFDDLEELLLGVDKDSDRYKVLSELSVSSRFTSELVDLYPTGWDSDTIRRSARSVVGYAWIAKDNRKDSELEAFSEFGDSMAAGAHPIYVGDTIIVDKVERAEDGALVVIQLEDGARLCRLLRRKQYVTTNPLKTDPTPITLNMHEASLLGRVVETRHTFKPHS